MVKCVADHEDLDLNHIKLGIVSSVCTPSTQDAEAGGSEIQGHPWLHNPLPTCIYIDRDTTLKFSFFSLQFLMKNIKMIKISVNTNMLCQSLYFS